MSLAPGRPLRRARERRTCHEHERDRGRGPPSCPARPSPPAGQCPGCCKADQHGDGQEQRGLTQGVRPVSRGQADPQMRRPGDTIHACEPAHRGRHRQHAPPTPHRSCQIVAPSLLPGPRGRGRPCQSQTADPDVGRYEQPEQPNLRPRRPPTRVPEQQQAAHAREASHQAKKHACGQHVRWPNTLDAFPISFDHCSESRATHWAKGLRTAKVGSVMNRLYGLAPTVLAEPRRHPLTQVSPAPLSRLSHYTTSPVPRREALPGRQQPKAASRAVLLRGNDG